MKTNHIKTISLILLAIAGLLILFSYSPIAQEVYADWKESNEPKEHSITNFSDIKAKTYECSGGSLIASKLKISMKALEDNLTGVKIELSPTYPESADHDDGYKFTLLLQDQDGFTLKEFYFHESDMTTLVDKNAVPRALTYNSKINFSLQDFLRTTNVAVLFSSTPERKEKYEKLRAKSASEILADLNDERRNQIAQDMKHAEAMEAAGNTLFGKTTKLGALRNKRRSWKAMGLGEGHPKIIALDKEIESLLTR